MTVRPETRLLVLVAALAGLLLSCAAPPTPRPPAAATAATAARTDAAPRYALVVDAGSSGSRLHLYRWTPAEPGGLPRIEATGRVHRVTPGISAFAGDPAAAADSLRPLVDFALAALRDEGADPADTPLWLAATAGVRLLAEPERRSLLSEVRESLADTPFDLRGVRTLPGEAEGLYGWMSVNYLLGHLQGGGPFPSVGALDLGGASTQITFVPVDHPREGGTALRLGDTTWRVYSHSDLGLGQDRARERVASPACYPRGYPLGGGATGTGDYAACRSAIRELLQGERGGCAEPPCSLMGVYQPPLHGDFFAFSGYFYAADFFSIGQSLDLGELERRARAFCAKAWDDIVRSRPESADSPYLPRQCFNAAYVVTLLVDGYGFPADTRSITVPERVQGSEVGWTLGFLVHELAGSAD